MRRRLLAIAVLLLLCAAASPRYAGRPLTDALQDLQKQGLRIVYSDDVVRREMIVQSEPRAMAPRAVLDELLAQQHLRAVAGPRGTLIVEKAAAPPPLRPQSSATPPPKLVENIVVTPSRFDVMGSDPARRELFDRDEVQRLPHLGDDLYRAIGRLPGTTSADATARFHIRGGSEDETLVVLDGAEIEDPFHMKDFYRVFSTIDADSVGSVDVLTGGFPAEYGGRLSGVLDISTIDPDRLRTEAGVSFLSTRLASQGTWSGGSGQWLVAARHGYLRDLLNLLGGDNEVDPSYDDLLGKVQWTPGPAAVVSAHVLASHDQLRFDSNSSRQRASYTDEYVWVNARGMVAPRLFVRSVATVARFSRDRSGSFDDHQSTSGSMSDDRSARFVSLKNDMRFEAGARQVVEAGVAVKRASADYAYLANASFVQLPSKPGVATQNILRNEILSVAGTQRSAFVSDRVRLTDRLVVEGGLRAASESYTPDGSRLLPRANAAWTPFVRTAVRVSWGRFDQPQNVSEVDVQDGLSKISPAERAEHRVGGIEHSFGNRVTAKLEAYEKRFSSLRPRFENIYDHMALFPELRYDRVRIDAPTGRARGAELLVRFDGQPLSAWLSWARASATDRIDGRDVPRLWDQRNTVTASTNYRAGNVWNVNVTALYHTGWPMTPVVATIVNGQLTATPGALDSQRLPAYKRVDLRLSRNVETIHGVGSAFVELFNVLNQSNTTRISGFRYETAADGSVNVTALQQSMFGVIPSFGVSWRF